MGIFTNRVKKDEIKEGDHIYAYRAAFTYSHHGIFVGENKVVHFTSSTPASRFTFSGMSDISASCPTSGMSDISASCPTSGMSDISASCPTSGMSDISASCPTSGMSDISASCPTSGMSDISVPCPTSGMSNISASCPTPGMSNLLDSFPTSYPDCGFRQPNSGVVISCLDCFLQKGCPYRFQYGVGKFFFLSRVRGGACTTASSDPPQTVIYRANHLLQNGFGNYDVFKNNCEDFALYCSTGLLIVNGNVGGSSGQASGFVAAPLSFLVSSSAKYLMSAGPVGFATLTAGMYHMSRYSSDIGVRTDVTKVAVEDVAEKLGGLNCNELSLYQDSGYEESCEMGIFTNRVKKDEIKEGDHIYAYRAAFTYSHHGIFVGENKVVHFTSSTPASRFTFSGMSDISASCPTSGMSDISASCPTSGMSDISASCPTSGMSDISASCPTSGMSDISVPCPTSGMSNISASCPTPGMSNLLDSFPTSYPDCGFRQPNSGVVISCLDCFLQKGCPYRFQYGVGKFFFLSRVRGGACTTASSDPPQTVIYRANHLLQNGFGNYDVFKNNCEDFALYCSTGLLIVNGNVGGSSGQASGFVAAPLSFLVSSSAKYLMSAGPVGFATLTAGMYHMSRYSSDIGVRTDVTKVAVEDVAEKLGGLNCNEEVKENKAEG